MSQLAMFIGMFLTSTKQAINIGMLIFILGAIAQIIFSISFVLTILYDPSEASPAYAIILQFWPPFNFSKMIFEISSRSNQVAVDSLASGNNTLLFSWSNLYDSTNEGTFSVPAPAASLWYQVMDMGIYTILAWYCYNVLPSEKGEKPWFFLTPNYWRSNFGISHGQDIELPPVRRDDTSDSDVIAEAEHARSDTDAALRVIDIQKTFYSLDGFAIKKMHAVKGVSLSISKGQVFALLGHNGAGKTTTLNMLTGLLRPSGGDAILFGKSVSYDLPDVQNMLGVCPQHDILWQELTAREHLQIFAELKRIPKEEQEDQIAARLKDVLLVDAADKYAGTYSGGMKRRLSVAISAIGAPQVIYLDEPTTGLDPQSRREIWGAIQRLKKGRVIILTSHSMEEADALGDRIGVMAHGRLKCIGTSLHLKNKFGLGYRLNLTTIPGGESYIRDIVSKMIPNAVLIAETGVNFVFGVQTKDIGYLVPFFKYIEDNIKTENFFIKDWGMSQTTLEEVFLKVTRDDNEVIITTARQ